MFRLEAIGTQEPPKVLAKDLKVGDLILLDNDSLYPNEILLRTPVGFVSLTAPELTWTLGATFANKFRRLPSGTSFRLTVE